MERLESLRDRAKPSLLVAYSLLAATLATLLGGYQFGTNHFIDFDPMVRGLMDPQYLPEDFFVSVGREFGPRWYFAWIFATLAPSPEGLPVVYFLATLLVNTSVAILTGFLARDIFRSNLAGMFAIAVTMSATFFRLGGASNLFATQPNANRLALPLAIAAVWAAVRDRPMLVGFAIGSAALLHPLFGLQVGGLLLVSMGITVLIRGGSVRRRTVGLTRVAGGAAVLAVMSLAILIPYRGSPRIPDDILIDTLFLRLSHELLPGEYGVLEWVSFAFFALGAVLSWVWLGRRRGISDKGWLLLSVFAVSIVIAIAGGFVLTAVIPTRLGVIASVSHRLSFMLALLGLLAIVANAARLVSESKLGAGVFLYSTAISPISVGLGHVLVWATGWHGDREGGIQHPSPGIVWSLAGLSLLIGMVLTTSARHLVLFVAVSGVGAWLLLVRDRVVAVATPIVLTLVLGGSLIGVQARGPAPQIFDAIGPQIFPAHLSTPVADIARRARAVTTPDSIFVTPPAFGTFRIIAERGIVADFKAIPYQEDAILEWRSRMHALYGTPTTTGFAAEREFDDRYRSIGDGRLRSLCQSYGATHAILYSETETSLPVLVSNGVYSVVEMEGC